MDPENWETMDPEISSENPTHVRACYGGTTPSFEKWRAIAIAECE